MAADGIHEAEIESPCFIRLKMTDVEQVEEGDNYYFLNTGSPHYVEFTDNLKDKDVISDGRNIRNNARFREEGTNVNFVEIENEGLFVRTYERGVENETYACGTGIVASAISAALKSQSDINSYPVRALGGDLVVSFEHNNQKFENIWLEGPAAYVFSGDITV
jgi:diaminopimelate epimerase